MRLFAMNLTTSDAAQLCGLSVRSVNTLYPRIRVRLARECAAQSPFSGEIEADESYFGPKRIRGKRGRGAGGKTIVFGLLKQATIDYSGHPGLGLAQSIIPSENGKVWTYSDRKSVV